uniref:Uncharacterized protein n=1 Tax=Anopheles quadriannulatus TaxID=34691 RepID=A0A182XTP5_ANOQN
ISGKGNFLLSPFRSCRRYSDAKNIQPLETAYCGPGLLSFAKITIWTARSHGIGELECLLCFDNRSKTNTVHLLQKYWNSLMIYVKELTGIHMLLQKYAKFLADLL